MGRKHIRESRHGSTSMGRGSSTSKGKGKDRRLTSVGAGGIGGDQGGKGKSTG